ncbi:hypothetical protein I9Y31_002081 [Clostridium perfringens]|nr:hypothetical protein [Clostridium perfringens]
MISLSVLIKLFLICFLVSGVISGISQVVLKEVSKVFETLSLVVLKKVLNNNKNDNKIPFIVRCWCYVLLKLEYLIIMINQKVYYRILKNCKLLFCGWISYIVISKYSREIFNIIEYIFLSKIYLAIIFLITVIIIKGSYKRRLRKNLKEDIYKEVIKEYLLIKDYIFENIIDECENSFIFWRRIKNLEYSNEFFSEENDFIEEYLREKLEELDYLQYVEASDEEIKEAYTFLYNNLPTIKELKHNELKLKNIMVFWDKYDEGSRYEVIDSIDRRLGIYMLELKRWYKRSRFYLGKKRYVGFFYIKDIDEFKKNIEDAMRENLYMIIRILFVLEKIECRLKLDKKEDSISEYIINKFKK